jgi:hypothetical protein
LISTLVASDPEVRRALVSERVPYAQTSAAVSPPPPPETAEIARSMLFASTYPMVPGVVIVVVATFHTDAGREESDELIEVRDAPRDVEAVSTDVLVFAFTTAASEDVAIPTRVSVFVLIAV